MATAAQLPGGDVLRAGSFKANAAITTQYLFVKQHTVDGEVVLAGAGDRMIGVAQNKPKAAEATDIITEGESLLVVDGGTAIANGDSLKADGSGRGLKTTVVGDIIGAVAIEDSTATGDVIRVRVLSPRPYG